MKSNAPQSIRGALIPSFTALWIGIWRAWDGHGWGEVIAGGIAALGGLLLIASLLIYRFGRKS
jgi:hypothetical protein